MYHFRYADILADKIQQKLTAVEKIVATRKVLREKIENFKKDKIQMMPLVGKITEQSKSLQTEVSDKKTPQIDCIYLIFMYLFSLLT